MALTSLLGAVLMGLLMDGILRTILENKERELLSSRHLTLSIAYRERGLVGVERLLRHSEFHSYYIHFSDPENRVLWEQNPDHLHFDRPLVPMPALNGSEAIPGWQETYSDRGFDYDLLTRRLPDGGTLRMAFCERPQENYFHHFDRLMGWIVVGTLVAGLLGVILFLCHSALEERP